MSYTIHHQNIQQLLIEIYKSQNGLDTGDLGNLFQIRNLNYSLRGEPSFLVPSVNTVLSDQNYLRYFGAAIWNSVPLIIRNSSSIAIFKEQINKWKPETCPCRLCQDYVKGLGFIKLTE